MFHCSSRGRRFGCLGLVFATALVPDFGTKFMRLAFVDKGLCFGTVHPVAADGFELVGASPCV